ncbi:predicted protein [Postia placenta Mad-698-R]|nr:predicted protein [Postia placenta Mad-698-R]
MEMPSGTGKLHLKRTPAEQAERDFRKAKKATKKAAKKTAKRRRHADISDDELGNSSSSSKRQRAGSPSRSATDYPFVFDDDEYGPPPPPPASTSSHRAHKPDYDEIYARLEEERFREKMFGAMAEDERLDGLESHLNNYAHVPRRWRGGGMDRIDDELGIDPQMMEEEDYTEWVRAGMWRRKHAEEYAEHERKAAERNARRAREEAVREETARLEKNAEADRRRRRRSRERRRAAEARELYDVRWKELLSASSEGSLRFSDIPWPVLLPDGDSARGRVLTLEHFTVEAISAFLLPTEGDSSGDPEVAKSKKEKLRETMLRFHPDKFEGRITGRVRENDQEKVKEAVGIVVRTVTGLMGDGK